MGLWLAIFAVGIVTYIERALFIVGGDGPPGDTRFRRGLRFVPASVLMALIVPDLLVVEGRLLFSLENGRLLAGLVAIAVAWRTRSMLWTLLSGMVVLLALQGLAAQ